MRKSLSLLVLVLVVSSKCEAGESTSRHDRAQMERRQKGRVYARV